MTSEPKDIVENVNVLMQPLTAQLKHQIEGFLQPHHNSEIMILPLVPTWLGDPEQSVHHMAIWLRAVWITCDPKQSIHRCLRPCIVNCSKVNEEARNHVELSISGPLGGRSQTMTIRTNYNRAFRGCKAHG